jgi:hypothetical protein
MATVGPVATVLGGGATDAAVEAAGCAVGTGVAAAPPEQAATTTATRNEADSKNRFMTGLPCSRLRAAQFSKTSPDAQLT